MPKGIGYSVNENGKCDPTAERALSTLGEDKRMPAREAEEKLGRMDITERMERRMRMHEKIDTKY